MLDTVLKIGKAFRESPDGLKHHRYIKPCPQDTDKRKILRLSIPVTKDFVFDFESVREITDENELQKLFFLIPKTSDSDSVIRYFFGDIWFMISKKKESGNYRVGKIAKSEKDFLRLCQLYEASGVNKKEKFALPVFHNEFNKNSELIERILCYQCGITEYLDMKRDGDKRTFFEIISDEVELKRLTARQVFKTIKQSKTAKKTFKNLFENEEIEWNDVEPSKEFVDKLVNYSTGELFLHFDFEGKHWYEFEEEINIINQKLLEDFVELAEQEQGYMLKKFLYKTLNAGNYKAKLFNNTDEVLDLMYAVDYSSKALLNIPSTDIKVIVLPRGENLAAEHYEKFQTRTNSLDNESKGEIQIKAANQPDDSEFLFKQLIENIDNNIVQFDLVFCKKGGATSPDTDLIEISAIDKSFLKQQVGERVARIKGSFYNQFSRENYKKQLNIIYSFQNILKSPASDMKKYKKHMLKVLPQIYTATYYRDPILLPALIERVQYEIRNTDKPESNHWMFKDIKFDFYFLTTIQNIGPEGGNLMKIQESQSYRIGTLLGRLAQNFAGSKTPIKSFEKSYVGNLSRRIGTITDLCKFKTFIEEKIVIHEKNYENNRHASLELAQEIKNFSGRYDKNECAFGFFESYFSPFIGKDDLDKEEEKHIENQEVLT